MKQSHCESILDFLIQDEQEHRHDAKEDDEVYLPTPINEVPLLYEIKQIIRQNSVELSATSDGNGDGNGEGNDEENSSDDGSEIDSEDGSAIELLMDINSGNYSLIENYSEDFRTSSQTAGCSVNANDEIDASNNNNMCAFDGASDDKGFSPLLKTLTDTTIKNDSYDGEHLSNREEIISEHSEYVAVSLSKEEKPCTSSGVEQPFILQKPFKHSEKSTCEYERLIESDDDSSMFSNDISVRSDATIDSDDNSFDSDTTTTQHGDVSYDILTYNTDDDNMLSDDNDENISVDDTDKENHFLEDTTERGCLLSDGNIGKPK